MNRAGVTVDVAHSGWRTSLEAARCSTKLVVASHTAAAGQHKHIRGKPDEVLKALADSGAYAGICCIPAFLGGKGDIAALLDHLDYVVRKVGVDHVAIGTDVAYRSRNDGRERRKLPRAGRKRVGWQALWPADPWVGGTAAGRESLAWTNWPLFTVGLVQRGYKASGRKYSTGSRTRESSAEVSRPRPRGHFFRPLAKPGFIPTKPHTIRPVLSASD